MAVGALRVAHSDGKPATHSDDGRKVAAFTSEQAAALDRNTHWRDLERDSRGTWWNIPAELTKTNRAHRVPLSPQALAVIEALRPLTGSTEWVLASRADGKRLTWLSHSSARLREWSGLEHFTPHDLRRTAATWLGRSGVRPDTIDQLLNHAAGRITRTYNRAGYDAEKRQAVILLGELVESVLAGEERSNVVKIA